MKDNLFAIFIVMAMLAPGAAAAGISQAPASVQEGESAELDSGQAVLGQLLELSREAKVSLSEAIAVAERLHRGSRTMQIGFERAGSPEYRVRTVRNGVIWENYIDAKNGRVVGGEAKFSLGELSSDDRRDIDALKHVTRGLSDAVLFAERVTAGKAVGGCLIDEDGAPNFAVVVSSCVGFPSARRNYHAKELNVDGMDLPRKASACGILPVPDRAHASRD